MIGRVRGLGQSGDVVPLHQVVVLLELGIDRATRGQRVLARVVPLLEVRVVLRITVPEAVREDLIDDAVLDPVRRHERGESRAVVTERRVLDAGVRESLRPEPRARRAILILEHVLGALRQLQLGAEVLVDAVLLDGLHRDARLWPGRPPHQIDAGHVIEVGARRQLEQAATQRIQLLRALRVLDAVCEHLAVTLLDRDRRVALVDVANGVLASEPVVRFAILTGLVLRPAVGADDDLVRVGAGGEQQGGGELTVTVGVGHGRLAHSPVIEGARETERVRLVGRAELEGDLTQTQLGAIRLLDRAAIAHGDRLILEHEYGVLAAEAIRRGLRGVVVSEPLVAIHDELVLHLARREIELGGPHAILVVVLERVRGGVPDIEAAGDRDRVDSADDRLVAERDLGRERRGGRDQQECGGHERAG